MCNCLQTIKDRWPEPFEQPIMINRKKDFNMEVGDWAVKVYSLNSSGTIKAGSLQHLILSYCPICGCKLTEDNPDEPITP